MTKYDYITNYLVSRETVGGHSGGFTKKSLILYTNVLLWWDGYCRRHNVQLEKAGAVDLEKFLMEQKQKKHLKRVPITVPSDERDVHGNLLYPQGKYTHKTVEVELSDRSLNAYQTAVVAFYDWMDKRGYTQGNPMSRVEWVTFTPKDPIYLSNVPDKAGYNELEDFQATMSTNPLDEIIFLLLFGTGMRNNELCNLTVGDIDFANCKVTIRAETAKGRKGRVTYFPDKYLYKIMKWCNGKQLTDFVIISPRTTGGIEDRMKKVSDKWNQKRIDMGLPLKPSITPHKLRHSFCSNFANGNISILELAKLMGHSDVKTTMIYAHPNVENPEFKKKFNMSDWTIEPTPATVTPVSPYTPTMAAPSIRAGLLEKPSAQTKPEKISYVFEALAGLNASERKALKALL